MTDMDRRTITIEDLLALKWIGDPQLSPDGTRVVYVLTVADRDANTYRSHLGSSLPNFFITISSGNPVKFLMRARLGLSRNK